MFHTFAFVGGALFPAQAGVIPFSCGHTATIEPVPRASGGDHGGKRGHESARACSPRKRG